VDLDEVQQGLTGAGLPADVISEVLEAYTEAKRRFSLGDLRPQEVEGGRYSEGVFRLLQHAAGLKVTALGKMLPGLDKLLPELEGATGQPDSVRLHIPRTLKLIYDVRNKRDAAHLGDGIDPNLQDATLVVVNMDWVLAELVRLYHGVSADRAQRIIENLVTKEIPAVQEIAGQPVINANLRPREQALLMLYRAGSEGATLDELADWLRVDRKTDLKARLGRLDQDKTVLLHPKTRRYYITDIGVREVESRELARPI